MVPALTVANRRRQERRPSRRSSLRDERAITAWLERLAGVLSSVAGEAGVLAVPRIPARRRASGLAALGAGCGLVVIARRELDGAVSYETWLGAPDDHVAPRPSSVPPTAPVVASAPVDHSGRPLGDAQPAGARP